MSKLLYTGHGAAEATQIARSRLFNIDNGAGTTLDDAMLRRGYAITLTRAIVVYTTETAGTVAAATVGIGTTVGGVDLVAATALENGKAIGASTALVLAATAVPANTPVIVRHTGIATTALGEYYVELSYTVDEQ
jgi:hypothetical protein